MSDDVQTPGGRPRRPIPPEARAANLALWNHWTRVHEKSAFYDVAGFKAGATSLWPVEREELGPFVHEGTTLLHLQCHFGLDTLSWARLGAEVVGLDLSDAAIALAQRLADEVGLAARAEFVCADLYDADAHLGDRRFDVVFVSWGAIEWLPDLERWADIIARHLRPGGTFYMAEIHPFGYALDEVPGEHDVQVKYRLLPAPATPDIEPVEGSYADPDADTTGLVAYGWQHSLAEVTGALIGAGLRIEHLHEFPTSPAPFWDWMIQDEDRWWWLPDAHGRAAQGPAAELLAARHPAGGRGGLTMLDDYLEGEPRELGRGRRAPRRLGAVRRGRVQGRPHRAERHRARGARPAGRRGHVAAAPAVPLRPRHAELGAPGSRRHRRRLLRRGDQDGARPGRRGRPLRARHLRRRATSRACRTSSPGSSTSSSPPGARSSGWATSSAGPT